MDVSKEEEYFVRKNLYLAKIKETQKNNFIHIIQQLLCSIFTFILSKKGWISFSCFGSHSSFTISLLASKVFKQNKSFLQQNWCQHHSTMLSPMFLVYYSHIKGFVSNYVIKQKTMVTRIMKTFTHFSSDFNCNRYQEIIWTCS